MTRKHFAEEQIQVESGQDRAASSQQPELPAASTLSKLAQGFALTIPAGHGKSEVRSQKPGENQREQNSRCNQHKSLKVRSLVPITNGDQPCQAFSNLNGEAVKCLNASSVAMTCMDGTVLFGEGDVAKYVYIVRNGRIKLSVTSRMGNEIIFRVAGPGEVLGLSSVFTETKHETAAETSGTCSLSAIATRNFLDILRRYPDAAKEATRCLLNDYRIVISHICRLGLSPSATGRVARLLLDWRRSASARRADSRLTMTFTHAEIAGMAATSRETVTRILQRLQRERIIRKKGISLTFLRPEALEQLAEGVADEKAERRRDGAKILHHPGRSVAG